MAGVTSALVGGALLGAAGSALSSKGGKGGGQAWSLAPEYEESEGARKLWWDKLQKWGSDPNYGAISPDWADIWSQATKKVNEYYSGTPTSGQGAYGKLKGTYAARNMAGSPAMTRSLARMAAEQGGQIQDLAQTEAIKKAEFGERGRQLWLGSLEDLQARKPVSQFYTEPVKASKSQMWGAGLSGLGGALSTYGMGSLQMQNALKMQGMLNPAMSQPMQGLSYASPTSYYFGG